MVRRLLMVAWAVLMAGSWVAEVGQAQAETIARESIGRDAAHQKRKDSQSPIDRRITMSFADVQLGVAIDRLAAAAGVTIVYTDRVLPIKQLVSVKLVDVPLRQALDRVLDGTGVIVRPTKSGRLVLVNGMTDASSGVGVIEGRVTDAATGRAIRGVELLLEGTSWRAETDTTGGYRLSDVEAGTYNLIVRRLGYMKQSRSVVVRDGQVLKVDVVLTAAAVKLDELVTTATGQQRRRDLGNAITTINADSVLQSAPIRNLTDLLEDRVPGLTVQHTSGAPGDPARLRLRGIGSVMRGNDPVVIVDGIRLYSSQSEQRSGNLTNLGCPDVERIPGNAGGTRCGTTPVAGVAGSLPAPSPLDQIDPNIIEKIEVFKGASAATLYGADAANGVIFITTKKGRPGPTRWNTSMTHGRTVTPGKWSEGYYRWGHDLEDGSIRICPLIDLACVQDSIVQFQALNDPDMTILGQGRRTAFSLTASGGTQALTYSVTGTYDDELGLLQLPAYEVARFRTTYNREAPDWMRRPHGLKKWSVASSVTALLGPTADVTLSTALRRSEQRRTALEGKVSRLATTLVDRINGFYYPTACTGPCSISPYGSFGFSSFLQDYYTQSTASAITFTTGLNAQWRPRSWLNISGQAGLDASPREDERFLPFGLPAATDSGVLIRGTGRSLVSTFNLQGTVRRPLRWGFVFVTSAGTNLTTNNTADIITSAAGLMPGTSTVAGARYFQATENQVTTSSFGWYIEPRITGQRISLSTGIRLDGGSSYGARVTRAGGGGGLLSLPKFNGSWVISEEPFFPFKGLFSSLRLLGAYGQAQVQPSAYDRLRTYVGQVGERLRLDRVGNTELRPERSVEFEGGFEAYLLDSRVMVELTGYHRMQEDALMPVRLPLSVNGGGTTIQNIGNIRNQGLELQLEVTPVRTRMLTWNARLLYSRNTNTLVKLGRGVLPNKEQGLVEGYPVQGRWAKPILGYADQDGNGVLSRNEIQIGDSLLFMGRLHPNYTSSLHTNIVLFGGAVGITAGFSYDAGATQINEAARTNWVLVRGLADPTATLGEQAAALASTTQSGVVFADQGRTDYGITQDVSTFRFRSLSVNYVAPMSVARFLRAQQLTVAVQGENLGLHSTYQGKDPDVNSWSAGENIVDRGQLPLPRTWQLALFLQY